MPSDFSLILSDKGEGVTSFKSLNEIKNSHKGCKVGHAGTLDKFASGLMIVMVGGATRLNPIFSSFSKRYVATIKFGAETTTLDPEGEVVATSSHIPTLEEIEKIIPSFIGRQKQIPPVYSALHVNGKRAYEEARKGKNVEMAPRDIEIYSLEILDYSDGILKIDCSVSKGTYIRSLGRDIALSLGTRGHLIALRRTEVGPFSLDDIALDTFALLEKTGLFSRISLSQKNRRQIENGVKTVRWIENDSAPSLPYGFAYFGDTLYGIIEKGSVPRFILRLENEKV